MHRKELDYTAYVYPYIGTIGHMLAATSPNVQSPHGAAVVAPVFRPGVRDVYISDKIYGFGLGDAVVMPAFADTEPFIEETASEFDHDLEQARPDHYSVYLLDSRVSERHTAMEHYGMAEFVFDENADEYRIAVYAGNCKEYYNRNGRLYFAKERDAGGKAAYYTVLDVSGAKDIREFHTKDGLKLLISYNQQTVGIKFAVSIIGFACIDESFDNELDQKGFDDIRTECNAAWNALLGKVRVEGGTERMKRVFYTALYRAAARMQNYSVNGQYRGFDGAVHCDEGHRYYTNDGIWDTFRGMHPLQLLLEPEVHRDIIESYLRMYQQSGWLPRFPSLAGNIPCMIGHHTVSILAESIVKGIPFDYELAYEAAKKNALQRTMLPWTDGEADELTKFFYRNGYLPALEEDEEETCERVHSFENRQSVAVTIEHSYDDFCLSVIAEKLGKKEDAAFFAARSENYKKLYNKDNGFFHPRKEDGSFVEKFDPKFCGGWGGRKYFAENNAYIYNFAAQHDIKGLISLFGGTKFFAEKLNNLFLEQYDGGLKCEFIAQYPDATGLTGQFCMGNEPSFHIPYLFNYCGEAYKTQKKIHELIRLWFTDSPLGICGDEDGGAMSAFLAFSAMGFYPVNPVSGNYDIGSPVFDKTEIDLPNGKTFTVTSYGASCKAKYITAAYLNGEPLSAPVFSHEQMMEGGELKLIMSEKPDKEFFNNL